MSREFQVTFDVADPVTQARFWAEALGYVIPGPPGAELAEDDDPIEAWMAFLESVGVPEDERNRASAIEHPTAAGLGCSSRGCRSTRSSRTASTSTSGSPRGSRTRTGWRRSRPSARGWSRSAPRAFAGMSRSLRWVPDTSSWPIPRATSSAWTELGRPGERGHRSHRSHRSPTGGSVPSPARRCNPAEATESPGDRRFRRTAIPTHTPRPPQPGASRWAAR
jgi:hypothetical protein